MILNRKTRRALAATIGAAGLVVPSLTLVASPGLWAPSKPAIIRAREAAKALVPGFCIPMVKAAGGTGVITFVNSSSQTVIDGTNLILSMPAGLQEGDVVCAVAAMNVAIPAEPSGWTTINTNGRVRAIIKVMGSTPDTSADWGDSGSAIQSGAAVAMAFRGVDPTTPQDVTAQNINSSADPQPITPSSNNCCIVILSGASTLDTTIGTITGYSTPVAAAASNSASSTAGACYRILSGGGGAAEDPAAWSTWSISGNGGSHTVALRPWL